MHWARSNAPVCQCGGVVDNRLWADVTLYAETTNLCINGRFGQYQWLGFPAALDGSHLLVPTLTVVPGLMTACLSGTHSHGMAVIMATKVFTNFLG